jgi:hypothetical protein
MRSLSLVVILLASAAAACGGGIDNPPAVPGQAALVVLTGTDLNAQTAEDAPVEFTGLAKVEPAGAGAPAFTVSKAPAHGKLTLAGGKASYTPEKDFNGADQAEITATLEDQLVVTRVTITVTAVNDPPAFTAGADIVVNEDAGAQTFTGFVHGVVPGPANESAQGVLLVAAVSNGALFSVPPSLDAAGNLTFTPAPDAAGSAVLTLTATDDGGTAGGAVNTATQAVQITVAAVNDAPRFTPSGGVSVSEDAGAVSQAWATAIAAGPSAEVGQGYAFTVTTDNPALFATAPAISTAGELTFRPAADRNGTAQVYARLVDNGGTANGGVNASPLEPFTISVAPVNDRPAVTAAGTVTVPEDAGAQRLALVTAVTPGPADEGAQSVTVTGVTNDAPGLFSAAPTLDADGFLSFTPAANAFGAAVVHVTYQDSGGTAGGGQDTYVLAVTVTVTAVNDAPTFTRGANQLLSEDAGAQSVPGFITGITAGPANEAGQTVGAPQIGNDNPALFSQQPALAGGTLTYTPAANVSGSATLTLRVADNGGTAGGGQDTAVQFATITVKPVNDAPAFTAGGNVTVLEDAGAQSLSWATNVSAGPADESWQTVSFSVTTANAALFTQAPAISPAGVLTYRAAANANGSAAVWVQAVDNGGTSSGGTNASPKRSFTLTVTPVNDAPDFTLAGSIFVLSAAGPQTHAGFLANKTAGPADEGGQTYIALSVTTTNNALFSVPPAIDPAGTLTFTPAGTAGQAIVAVRLQDSGGTAGGGLDARVRTFFLSIGGSNQPPTFTSGGNVTVLEDAGAVSLAWATNVSPGVNEAGQNAVFIIDSVDMPGLFAAPPTISPTGVLSFAPAANLAGTSNVTVRLRDDAGTAGGGVDTSGSVTFAIVVTPVNDAPAFTAGGDVSADEDQGPVSAPGWAAAIAAGPPGETEGVAFQIVGNSNPQLFAAGPTVSPAGDLSFTAKPNANGDATVAVRLIDGGGTANGGVNASAVTQVGIHVAPVNDAPWFWASGFSVLEDDPLGLGLAGYPLAVSLAAGPADEWAQRFHFDVTASTPALFAWVGVDEAGVLRFAFQHNVTGSADLTVTLHDDGGTASGGADSFTRTVRVTILAVNDAPEVHDATLTTAMSTFADIGLPGLAWDPEGDPVTCAAANAAHGMVTNMGGGTWRYSPTAGYTGPDQFTFTASDGRLASQGVVYVTVGADTVPPHFVAASSNPVHGAFLNASALAWGGALAPLRFVFDDPFLDTGALTVYGLFLGVPLVRDVQYWVQTSTPGVVEIRLDPGAVTAPVTGGILQFSLGNVQDIFGNAGASVDVAVWIDASPPTINWLEQPGSPAGRAIVQFNEQMAPASAAALVFTDLTSGAPVAVEPTIGLSRGSGFFTRPRENDSYFFVPQDGLTPGHEIRADLSGLTDLSGNPPWGPARFEGRVCCSEGAATPALLRLEWLDRATRAVHATALPDAAVLGALHVPQSVAGTNDLLRLVFAASLDPARGYAELNSEGFGPNRMRSQAAAGSAVLPNDAYVMDPGATPGFTWSGKSLFSLRYFGVAQGAAWGGNAGTTMLEVLGAPGDVTAPAVTALLAGRAAGADGRTPVLRPGDALPVAFSEIVDLQSVVPARFMLQGPAGTVPVTLATEGGMTQVVLHAADAQGRPALLAEGAYTLTVGGLTDLALPQNTMAATPFAFTVAKTARPAPQLVDFSPKSTDASEARVFAVFDDVMAPQSLTDRGDPASRGYRFEDLWGTTWIPNKSLAVRYERLQAGSRVELAPTNGSAESRVYRITILPGAQNADGTPFGQTAAHVFKTGGGSVYAPSFERADVRGTIFPATFFFMGVTMESSLSLDVGVRDGDGDLARLTLAGAGRPPLVSAWFSGWSNATFGAAGLQAAFPPGAVTPYTLWVTDASGRGESLAGAVRMLKPETLGELQPYVTPGPQPGRYTITGGTADAAEGDAIRAAALILSIVDTTSYPPSGVAMPYTYIPWTARPPGGGVSFTLTTPADAPLPHLTPPYAYMAIFMLQVPNPVGGPDETMSFLSAGSAPFNP